MKEVFVGSTLVIIAALAIASYAGERMISPDQSPPVVPSQILKH